MKLYASNEGRDFFDSELIMGEEEQELEKGLATFAMGMSRMVIEFLHRFARTEQQAEALWEDLSDMMESMVLDYIEGGVFAEVKASREGNELYAFMQKVFRLWLEHNGKEEETLARKFRGTDTMSFDVSADLDTITVSIVNGDGSVREEIDTFDRSLGDDPAMFEKAASIAYIIGVVLGDLVCTADKNPIRRLPHGPGVVDGGLMEQMRAALA